MYKTKENFKTGLDLYSGFDCIGILKKTFNAADLVFTCELIDQRNNKMWTALIRKTEDIDSGKGKMYIIEGTGRWQYLSGINSKYAAKINKTLWFASTRCNIDENYSLNF